MKCSLCDYMNDNVLSFAYANTEDLTKPLCVPCFVKEVERRLNSMEQTLHKKSCVLCGGKEYANNLFSIASAPLKLVCRSCVTILAHLVEKEAGIATLRIM